MVENTARMVGIASAAIAAILTVVGLADIARVQSLEMRQVVMFGVLATSCAAGGLMAFHKRPELMIPFFILGFVPMGMYLLGAPGYGRWIAVAQLTFLAAAVAMMPARLRKRRSDG